MLTRIPLPLFTVFNMGDPPTITVPKVLTNMTFPNGGKGGGPTWEKFPHFPVFYWGASLMYKRSFEACQVLN